MVEFSIEAMDISLRLNEVFRPHSPIDQSSLFAGRFPQIIEMIDAVGETGLHIILFGERGVGKTSLAKVFHDFKPTGNTAPDESRSNGQLIAPFITCDTSDTYSSIWHKVFEQVELVENQPRMGFVSAVDSTVINLASKLSDNCTTNDVVRLLQFLGSSGPPVIITIDEFDRLGNDDVTALIADTIKILSDNATDVTIIVVGVADSVSELIRKHASVERCCVQIRMPRMSPSELQDIIHRGLSSVGMTIEQDALDYIVSLSQGLPHYTHILGLNAARAAILERSSKTITRVNVTKAIQVAVKGVQESIRTAYQTATVDVKKTLYPQVLLACALAEPDEYGFFSAGDIRQPMSVIMHKPYDIPAFSKHLHDLSQAGRGPVLQRIGVPKRFRFRFVNPLMQPFVIMHGLDTKLITEDSLVELRGSKAFYQGSLALQS